MRADRQQMLTREAVAATLALAGIRSGASVLDLAPDAGLRRAARAMAGTDGRVDAAEREDPPRPRGYGYLLGVWSDRSAATVVGVATAAVPALAPRARVTVGSRGSVAVLVDELRSGGWTVLHATAIPGNDRAPGQTADLALAVARRTEP